MFGLATGSEPVISKLCWWLERLEPQCPARVSPLFGAIHGLAAGRPAQVDEGRVGRVEGCYTVRGQRGRAVGGARGGTGGGKRSRERVKGRSCVRATRGVSLESEWVTVRRGEGVTVVERVGRGGLVAQKVAVRAVRTAATT